MIGGVDDVQGGAGTEFLEDGAQELEVGESVASALEEEHRDFYIGEVVGAFGVWTTRPMQREAEEDQAAHAGQKALCGGLRGHAAAHGFASGKHGEFWGGLGCGADGGGDCRGEYRRAGGGVGGPFPFGGMGTGGGFLWGGGGG